MFLSHFSIAKYFLEMFEILFKFYQKKSTEDSRKQILIKNIQYYADSRDNITRLYTFVSYKNIITTTDATSVGFLSMNRFSARLSFNWLHTFTFGPWVAFFIFGSHLRSKIQTFALCVIKNLLNGTSCRTPRNIVKLQISVWFPVECDSKCSFLYF